MHTALPQRWDPMEDRWVDRALGGVLGVVFTAGLFFGIAYFQRTAPHEVPTDIEELRAINIPLDPPPPRIVEDRAPAEAAVPFSGIEIGASESPVKIAVVPPDLDALVPPSEAPPSAVIPVAQLYTNFRPKIDMSADFNRVFQQAEVDQKPAVLARPDPSVPKSVRGEATALRVVTLVLVDQKGAVKDVRILKTSGNQAFDTLIAQNIREEWLFSPAMKRGRNVRCLVEQTVSVFWKSGTPFDAR